MIIDHLLRKIGSVVSVVLIISNIASVSVFVTECYVFLSERQFKSKFQNTLMTSSVHVNHNGSLPFEGLPVVLPTGSPQIKAVLWFKSKSIVRSKVPDLFETVIPSSFKPQQLLSIDVEIEVSK